MQSNRLYASHNIVRVAHYRSCVCVKRKFLFVSKAIIHIALTGQIIFTSKPIQWSRLRFCLLFLSAWYSSECVRRWVVVLNNWHAFKLPARSLLNTKYNALDSNNCIKQWLLLLLLLWQLWSHAPQWPVRGPRRLRKGWNDIWVEIL